MVCIVRGVVLLSSLFLLNSPAMADSASIVKSVSDVLEAQSFNNGGDISASYPSAKLLPGRVLGPNRAATFAAAGLEDRIRSAHGEITTELDAFLKGLTEGPKAACQAMANFMQTQKGGGVTEKPPGKDRAYDVTEFLRMSANRTLGTNSGGDQYYSEFRLAFFIPKKDEDTLVNVFEMTMDWDQGAIATEGSEGWFYLYESAENPSCERTRITPVELSHGPLYEDDEVRALKKCFYIPQLDTGSGTVNDLIGALSSAVGQNTDYMYCNLNVYRRKQIAENAYLFTSMLYDVKNNSDCGEVEHSQERINRTGGATAIYLVVDAGEYVAVFNKGIQTYDTALPPTFNMNKMVETHYQERNSFREHLVKQAEVEVKYCSDFM